MTLKMNGKTVAQIKEEALAAVQRAKKTLRDREQVALPEAKEYTATQIRELREREGMSHGLFAKAIGVSKDTVVAWEHGRNTPRPMAHLLLSIVEADGLSGICHSLKKLERVSL